jgi:hypothetical protein
MRRIAVLIGYAAINASAIPAVAEERTSIKDLGFACVRLATVNSKQVSAADKQTICRACAAPFYESVMLRQASPAE